MPPPPLMLFAYLKYFCPVGSPSSPLSLLPRLSCRLSAFPLSLCSVPRLLSHGAPRKKNSRGHPNEPFFRFIGFCSVPVVSSISTFYFSFFLLQPFILISSSPLTTSSYFSVFLLFLSSMGLPCVKKNRGCPNGPLSLVLVFSLRPCDVFNFLTSCCILLPLDFRRQCCLGRFSPILFLRNCPLPLLHGVTLQKNSSGRPNGPFSLALGFFCSVPVLSSLSYFLGIYSFYVFSSLLLRSHFRPPPVYLYVSNSSLPLGALAKKRQGSSQWSFC